MKLLEIHHQVAVEGAVLLAEATELVLQPLAALFQPRTQFAIRRSHAPEKSMWITRPDHLPSPSYKDTVFAMPATHVVAQRQRGESHGKSSSRIVRRVMHVQLWLM